MLILFESGFLMIIIVIIQQRGNTTTPITELTNSLIIIDSSKSTRIIGQLIKAKAAIPDYIV